MKRVIDFIRDFTMWSYINGLLSRSLLDEYAPNVIRYGMLVVMFFVPMYLIGMGMIDEAYYYYKTGIVMLLLTYVMMIVILEILFLLRVVYRYSKLYNNVILLILLIVISQLI